ncbi:MAG: HD domain-containing phosphohydrolase [Pseudomonadota bacterium]
MTATQSQPLIPATRLPQVLITIGARAPVRLPPRAVGLPTADRTAALDGRLAAVAQLDGWATRHIDGATDGRFLADARLIGEQVALVLLNAEACREPRIYAELRTHFPLALIVGEAPCSEIDLLLPRQAGEAQLKQLLLHAADHRARGRRVHELVERVGTERRRTLQLTEVAGALTSSLHLDDLLSTIVGEARRMANCDAASLYLVEAEAELPTLLFKLSENDSVDLEVKEARLPLTAQSIAGYVALNGCELNLPDAYAIPESAPYVFNRSFDDQTGYRTRSMLVLPMRDHHDRVVGVLQFINRLDAQTGEVVAFGAETADLLRALASQAAVSIQKNMLIEDMERLFESFVQASVKSIEQRDPTTSGHSFRVADKTVALLEALPSSGVQRFAQIDLTADHLKEVRYAALLHDVGKIGVRENVLVKARKFSPERLAVLEQRVEVQRERYRRRALERQMHLLHHAQSPKAALDQVQRELERRLSELDDIWAWIQQANEPALMEQAVAVHLEQLAAFPYYEADGSEGRLLSPDDMEALSVRKGSLTPAEREQIQAHVAHTREFLDLLVWPPGLAQVPAIAGAHHEKLDGSGYPLGLTEPEIPLASRVMTVCDIYDALTAMDRPYKRAISEERALSILKEEAAANLIDGDLVQIFIDSGVYQRPLSATSIPR